MKIARFHRLDLLLIHYLVCGDLLDIRHFVSFLRTTWVTGDSMNMLNCIVMPSNNTHNFQLIQSHFSVAALQPWRSDTVFSIVQMFHIHLKFLTFHLKKYLCWFLGLSARITIRSDGYNYQSAFRLKIYIIFTRSKNWIGYT